MANEIAASGIGTGGMTMAPSLVVSVSPVRVSLSLATAPMSPATSFSTGAMSLPCIQFTAPRRSAASRVRLKYAVSGASVPENTRSSEIRPANGSEIVLNA